MAALEKALERLGGYIASKIIDGVKEAILEEIREDLAPARDALDKASEVVDAVQHIPDVVTQRVEDIPGQVHQVVQGIPGLVVDAIRSKIPFLR